MSEDPNIAAYQRKLQRINRDYQRGLADLAAAQAEGDWTAEDMAFDQITAARSEYATTLAIGQDYWNAANPPTPPAESAEQKAAKPLSHMTYQDAYELAKTSRYGVDDNAFRAGIAEVQRRRQRRE